jgi:glycerophosphoryl diester phosphodiesterase
MEPCGRRVLSLFEPGRDRPVIAAHRGDSFHAPENTLEAAWLGHESGADLWELDVRLTRDGAAVVMHDESLARTTDVAVRFRGDARGRAGFRVSDFDLAEIRTLDAGSWFVAEGGGHRSARSFGTSERLDAARAAHYASGCVRVPSLEEALLFTRELDWLVNVELKTCVRGGQNLVETVLDALQSTGTADRALISSFDHSEVAAALIPGRSHAAGILTESRLYRVAEYAADLIGADTVHVSIDVLGLESTVMGSRDVFKLPRNDIVSALKGRGIPLLVFTVNDRGAGSVSDRLAAIGVDGLFTDDPAGLVEFFRTRRRAGQGDPR